MKILLLNIYCLCCLSLLAQTDLHEWNLSSTDPIVVERLAGDTLTTSFLIEVKEEVAPHYHAYHSEHVVVISGRGTFVMNEKEMELNPGDYVFIPSGTVHTVKVNGNEPMRVLSIQCPEFQGKDRIKMP
jgi:mannose-6-phosphate isomerase-like protein (cupin superfamily)